MLKGTRSEALALIEAAVAAPSADNCHHVRFAIEEGGVALRTDDFYAACAEPHLRFLTDLSYGAVAENMRVWLAARGLRFRPVWFPTPEDPRLLLRVVWDDLTEMPADPGLEAQIATRHTNRKFFRGPALRREERETIDACVTGRTDIALDWFDERARRAALLNLIRRCEAERFRHARHHAELFDAIAFGAGWSAPTTERLAPGSLEVEWPLRGVFAALRRWPTMRMANRLGAATLLGLRAGDLPARLSPHVLVITSRLASRSAALEGGALFERVWLTAQSLGLALQPLAASAVLCHDALLNVPDKLDLTAAWRDLAGPGRQAVMVCRIGRATQPRIRSKRMPISEYIDRMPANEP